MLMLIIVIPEINNVFNECVLAVIHNFFMHKQFFAKILNDTNECFFKKNVIPLSNYIKQVHSLKKHS